MRGLSQAGKIDLPRKLAAWLDALDETGRWALLKLITGALRIGVSARLAKTAVAELGEKSAEGAISANDVEDVWHGLAPPYLDLFAWLEGREQRPDSSDPAPFSPAMLAHAIEPKDFDELDPADFAAEWKWDGIRVQAARGRAARRAHRLRLYSRTGEDISAAFPDLAECLGAAAGRNFLPRRRIADRAATAASNLSPCCSKG